MLKITRTIDTNFEVCGDLDDVDGKIDESNIQRFSSSTIFLRKWRYYNYERKIVKFASNSSPESKDANV